MLIIPSCRFKPEASGRLEHASAVCQRGVFQHAGQGPDPSSLPVRWEDTAAAGSGFLACKDNYSYHVMPVRKTRFQLLFLQQKEKKILHTLFQLLRAAYVFVFLLV